MTTRLNNGSNGTANGKTNGTGKTVSTTTTLTAVKDDKSKDEKPKSDLPPLEDRVLKIQQLFDLTTKREKLQETLKKLKSLNTASDNRMLSITIDDGGEEWETHNTEAIKFCISNLQKALKERLDEVNEQIKF